MAGAGLRDVLGGETASARARVVVNATGPWVDRLRRLEDPGAGPSIRLSKGAHALLRLEQPWSAALTIPHDTVRVSFAVPWEGMLLLGTTDTLYEGEPDDVAATPEDVDQILADNRAAIAELLERQDGTPTWRGLVLALDELGERLGRAWSPVSHLNAVCNNPELRNAYEACLPKLSEYWTEMGQNRALFQAYEALAGGPEAAGFDVAQKTILDHALRDFRLSGIDLPADKQQRYGEIQMKLSELGSRFSNQLLDATQAWTKQVHDEAALAGLTDSAKAQMKQAAEAKGLDGWLITLEFPSYYAVMTYADNRALRQEVYTAYSTRASDQGPNAGQHDNGPLMVEILDLRQELARLLGFAHFAELSLATKMADSTEQVLSFLRDLAVRSKPFARRDSFPREVRVSPEVEKIVRDKFGEFLPK